MYLSKCLNSAKPGFILVLFCALTLTGCDLSFMGDEVDSGAVGSDGACPDCLDFNVVSTSSYSSEDAAGNVMVADAGATLVLTNNTWRRTDQTFNITADTILEFDYESATEGEIQGIGFDENDDCCDNTARVFKLYGTQNWGITDFDTYTGAGQAHYQIPVGQHYTGSAMSLVFANDDDASSGNDSRFSNVRIIGGNGNMTQMTVTGDVGVSGVINSFIFVTTAKGATAWSGASSTNADYAATMSLMSSDFPLTSRSFGGSDLVSGFSPDFDMRSTVLNSGTTVGNINPLSTIITATAGYQGRGINGSSLAVANQVILRQLNFGFDTARISDPITSPILNSNVATIFRSNEALAEMIRRTSRALLLAGFSLSANQVIAHLSGDLTDGVIDGRSIGSDARVAATSSIVSAQILLETMTNDLQVGGFDVESRIDAAISMTHPGASIFTGDLTAPAEMISQAALTIAAAYDVSPTAANAALFDAVSVIPAGATVATARQILPADSSVIMDATIAKVAAGTAGDHEVVNSRLRLGLDSNAIDRTPPIISLIGPSTVPLFVGDAYVEQGATSTDDRDGDITSLITIDNQSVDTSVANDYFVTYNVSDFAGNAADEVVRTVSVSAPNIQDTIPPVITLVGNNPLNLDQGDTYVEAGATATDNVDGDITSRISIDNSAVTTTTVGNYPVTYNVSDTAGNAAAEVARSVIVSASQNVDTVPPVITLLGSNPITLFEGNSYIEPGATAVDNVDGDITASISIDSSNVNTATPGNYTVRYNVADAAGNAANQATRNVIVQSAPGGARPWEAILNEMVGFAQAAGTNGGLGRPLVTVTNLNNSGSGSLRQALADNPNGSWIRFSQGLTGTMTLSSSLNPPNNTTIDGRGADISIFGSLTPGSGAIIKTSGINVILMYFKIVGAYDGIRFGYYNGISQNIAVRNLWLHHISFLGGITDEYIDLSPQVQDITISYCYFQNESRGILVTRIDGAQTSARMAGVPVLNFTHHHNWYRNIAERSPLAEHSRLHTYNNLHEAWADSAVTGQIAGPHEGLQSGNNSPGIRFEKSIGNKSGGGNSAVVRPHEAGQTTPPVMSVGPHILTGGATIITKNPSQVFDPSTYYSYTAEDANAALEASIRASAGWQNVPFPE